MNCDEISFEISISAELRLQLVMSQLLSCFNSEISDSGDCVSGLNGTPE